MKLISEDTQNKTYEYEAEIELKTGGNLWVYL